MNNNNPTDPNLTEPQATTSVEDTTLSPETSAQAMSEQTTRPEPVMESESSVADSTEQVQTEPMPASESSVADSTEQVQTEPMPAKDAPSETLAKENPPSPSVEEIVPPPTQATASPVEESAAGQVGEAPSPPSSQKKWYIIKVPSGREDSTRRNLERKIKVNNVEEYFGRIIIPVEKQVEVKDGKKKIKLVKKLPGYLFVELEFNEHVFLTLRETYGVGGFLDGGNLNRPPLPMPEIEVQRTLADQDDFHPSDGKKDGKTGDGNELPKMRVKLDISPGDRVKIKEGMFANMEGEVKEILDKDGPSPKLKVELSIWGRPVPVDVDHWQADKV